MNIKEKAFRLIFFISLGISIMLFLVFFITYDFDSEEDYKIDIEDFNTSAEVMDLINKSIEDSTLNIASIEVNEGLLNKIIFAYYIENFNNHFNSDAFELKGLKIRIKNNNFYLDIHALFKSINYKAKITICFTFNSSDDEFEFIIKRINFGRFILPKSIVRSILDNTDENSIGYLVNSAISSLPYGELNINNLLFRIRRQEISTSIYNGYFNELFFDNDELFSKTSATIIDLLLSNNLVDISLQNGLVIKIDYSKILSDPKRLDFCSEVDDLESFQENKRTIIDESKFSIMLTSMSSPLDYIDLNYLINIGLNIKGFFNVEKTRVFIINDELHIMLLYSISEINSIIDYVFDKSFTTLKRIEVGRDNIESESSYILIETDNELRIFLNLLFEGLLKGNLNELSIDKLSIFNIISNDISSAEIINDNLYLYIDENIEVQEKIISCLSDSSFYMNLGLDIYESLDNPETIILNYNKYDILEKEAVINSLKIYFKEDIDVIKFISSLYGGN